MSRRQKTMIAVLAAALASACAGVPRQLKDGRVPDVLNERPDRSSYFEAIGIGASDPSLPTETQRRALARDAAIVKAQYDLLSMIKGVRLEGGYKVSRAIAVDSSLESKVDASIRGAEVLKSEFTKDGGCVVTLRLPKAQLAADTGLALR
ncbi:MAG: hypothetical protein KGM24_09110 [Elusimicrobia bacterium]|nr:hypothetical protein [Elusimicrobiota bacterium]